MFLVVGHLKTQNAEARQEVIDALTNVMNYSLTKEPGVTKYAITVPREEDDEQTVVVIEEYSDQAALDTHMEAAPLKELISLFGSKPLLAGAPTICTLDSISSFSRPQANSIKDIYITNAILKYKPGAAEKSTAWWQAVAKTSELEEQGTLVYAVCRTRGQADEIQTIEVYESKEYLWDVHAKSKAVQDNVANTRDSRESLQHLMLRGVAGYFHK